MVKFDSEHRTVKLDNVRKNNIVLVDLSKSLSESVFEQEYNKAAQIICNIIAENKQKKANSETCFNPCANRSKRKHNRSEYQTAVPFIGDRGTGKTSIMCSVLERLRCYQGETPSAAFNLGSQYDAIHFIAFDMIDANTLKSTEDVLEIILSRMLTYLDEIQGNCDFRDLYRRIDELYTILSQVYWQKYDARDEPGLTGLQRIADSQKAIDSFQTLVDDFTKTISRDKYGNDPCYLVIALDDIDMYQGSDNGMQDSQFALLERIYSFMRIPSIIVLMTYNEHILKRKCNSHFERIYLGSQKHKDCSLDEQIDIEALTGQFMSKLFPQEQRIYLPNYMFVDSANRSNLYVRPTLDDKNGDPEIISPFTTDQELPVKNFILRLIAYKTGVYFDAAGTKKHFFEPRNLRELGELFQVVNSLDDIPDETAEQEYVRRKNRQELLNYLYNQFALKHLNSEEYKLFRNLSMLPLVRQDRMLVDRIRQHRMVIADQPDSLGYLAKSGRDRWRYSYGELLHNIYYSTRIAKSKETEQTYFSKEFIHCILGTHTVVMNQSLRMTGARTAMLDIIGSSIAGRWANEMLPNFFEAGVSTEAGSVSLPVKGFFNWRVPKEVQSAIFGSSEYGDPEKILRQFMEALIVTGMFFTGFPTNGLKISLEAELEDNGASVLYLRSSSEDHICFNVLNFAINMYNALPSEDGKEDGYFSYIKEKLSKLGSNLAEQLTNDHSEKLFEAKKELEQAEEAIKEASGILLPEKRDALINKREKAQASFSSHLAWSNLVKEPSNKGNYLKGWNTVLRGIIQDYSKRISKWQICYPEFPIVLPVQNFDMMYNIVKRLASVSYHDIPEEARMDEVFDYYVRLYKNIAEELDNQDKLYFGEGESGFAAAFRNSLFYSIITAEKGKDYNPYIKQVLVSMMRSVRGPQTSRRRTYDFTI